jgi:hypothetical protein
VTQQTRLTRAQKCSPRGSRQIEHLGSGHSDNEVAALKLIAAGRIAAGSAEFDHGLDAGATGGTADHLM